MAGIKIACRAVLTDIEGTTGSIAFVKEVLFPYADAHLDAYVREHPDDLAVRHALDEAAMQTGIDNTDEPALLHTLHSWIAQDKKITALKTLQGAIWSEGYARGELLGHVYDDAARSLRQWHDGGLLLYVYSSGSIAAQHLIFGHSSQGDLRPLFTGFFDTTSGGKRDAQSYAGIARAIDLPAQDVVFLSDVSEELDAARAAGMQTVQVARPLDRTLPSGAHPSVASFDELCVEKKRD